MHNDTQRWSDDSPPPNLESFRFADARDVDLPSLEDRIQDELAPLMASLLAAVGPMPIARIQAVLSRVGTFADLEAEGFDSADLVAMVDYAADDDRRFFRTGRDPYLPTDLVAHLPSLLHGVVLTHRLSADEVERQMIDLDADLEVLHRRRSRYTLPGGGPVTIVLQWAEGPLGEALDGLGIPSDPRAAAAGSLRGPDGWLAGLGAGDVVALASRDAALSLTRCPFREAPAPTAALLAAFEAAVVRREWGDDDEDVGTTPADLVLDVLVHDPTQLRAAGAPISVVLDHLGLTWDGETLSRSPETQISAPSQQ